MKSSALTLIGALLLTCAVGWLDYVTGDELELFIVYLIPIGLVAWRVGLKSSIIVSLVGGSLWLACNVVAGHTYSRPLLGYWSELVILITFLSAAFALSRIRQLLDRERELNRELSVAMAKIKRLTGRLPICMSCKSIQAESGGWEEIEDYFTVRSEDDFVFKRTICPHCSNEQKRRSANLSQSASPQPDA